MPKKTYKPDEIIGKLREAEVRLSRGAGAAEVVQGFVLIPALAKGASTQLRQLTETTVRVQTYAGTATIFFGIVLVARTCGFSSLLQWEWGGLILACTAIAVALLGFVLSVVAVELMTRALHVPT